MFTYDVAVIGAGVSGASTAYQLGHYHVSAILLEKCADVGFGVSKANSGIIHGGFHHPVSSLKAKLEAAHREREQQIGRSRAVESDLVALINAL